MTEAQVQGLNQLVDEDDDEIEGDESPKKSSKKIVESCLQGKFVYDENEEALARELTTKVDALVKGGMRLYRIENHPLCQGPVFVIERSAFSAAGRLYSERFDKVITITNVDGGRGRRAITAQDVVSFTSTMSADERKALLEQLMAME